VDHPVAVRTDQGEVFEPVLDLAGHTERRSMVAFDVVPAAVAIDPEEAEAARLACDRQSSPAGVGDLVVLELWIALAALMLAEQYSAFVG